jgi:hypothetical protein
VPGVGLQWDLSRLFDYGEVSVITAPVSPAPDLTTTVDVTAGTQTISWTAEYLGYQLQVQTNDMTTGISTNWFPIEGTEDATSYSAPIDPANPTVFYRLSNQ